MSAASTATRRKAVFVAAALLLGFAAVGPAQDHGDVVGEWDLTVHWPGSPSTVELVVTEQEGELHARWSGPRGTLQGVGTRYVDGELRFSLEVTSTTDGSTFTTVRLPFRARVAGDALEGTLRSPSGGELAVEGSRTG